jgi:hypothetical protein
MVERDKAFESCDFKIERAVHKKSHWGKGYTFEHQQASPKGRIDIRKKERRIQTRGLYLQHVVKNCGVTSIFLK